MQKELNKLLSWWPWACALIILALPIFPFQDLPMHLTYAHLMANWDEVSQYYVKAPEYNVYFNMHYLLAFGAKLLGNVERAFRLGMAIYLVLFIFVLKRLEQSLKAKGIEIEWRAHFLLLALNGTMLLGFVSYAWGMPLILLSLAYLWDWEREGFQLRSKKLAYVLALLFVMGMMHTVLPWSFLLLALVLLYPRYPHWRHAWVFALPMALLWYLGVPGKGNLLNIPNGFLDNGYGFEWIDQLFRTSWSGVPTKMNYFFWQAILPVRIIPLMTAIFLFLALFMYLYRKLKKENPAAWAPPPYLVRSTWLLLFGLMLPWGIYWPSEITFINFRLVSTWGLLPLLLFGSMWLRTSLGRKAWVTLGMIQSAAVALCVWLAYTDFHAPMSLLEKMPREQRLLPLILDGKSPSMAKIYDTTHFAAMYYVIRQQGRSHQFWGRYTGHLPIDWQERERMPGPPDWRPWEFQEKHLEKADYVLFTFPYNRGRADMAIQGMLEKRSSGTQCVQNWCLYQIRQ